MYGNGIKKEYEIIKCDSAYELEIEINERLELGWELVGGVNTIYHPVGCDEHLQAIIRETAII